VKHLDFALDGIFWCGGRQWRCTDLGTRTVIAIRIDSVNMQSTTPKLCRTLDRAAAEAESWFNGPPYAVAEHVFSGLLIQSVRRSMRRP
jgi:hypothetical protein